MAKIALLRATGAWRASSEPVLTALAIALALLFAGAAAWRHRARLGVRRPRTA